jgi:hypothetical protein
MDIWINICVILDTTLQIIYEYMSTKKKHLHPLVNDFIKELDNKELSIPEFEKLWGIPKERIYGWKKQGTAPKEHDAIIVKAFLRGDAPPKKNADKQPGKLDKHIHERIQITGEIGEIIGNMQERLIQLESQNEVYESILASLLSKTTKDLPKSMDEIKSLVKTAFKRRFDEFRM